MATRTKVKLTESPTEEPPLPPHIRKKSQAKPTPPPAPPREAELPLPTRAERLAAGKELRTKCPRSSHAAWKPAKHRPDPVDLIEASNKGRLKHLIPLRYGRMLQSPFAFLRGAAAVMAHDLAGTPVSGIHVQACGDCHLMNFGTFASPERTLLFDINDFDETLPAPWEWDIKRLAASFVVAARHIGLPDRAAAQACVRTYREKMREFASLKALETWYARVDFDALIAQAPDPDERRRREKSAAKARTRTGDKALDRLTTVVDGKRRIVERPPFVFRPPRGKHYEEEIRAFLALYHESVPEDRQQILHRYRLTDVAMKVGGVGSVGTRCAIALFEAEADDTLILQYKEARPSVLEPYAGKSRHANHGQRVVVGQRLMQSASDIFLGWSREGKTGNDFYFRQLRDMNASITVEEQSAGSLQDHAENCGWALARAHAKGSGEAARLSGYLGKGEAFDKALVQFAIAYADQTEHDYAALVDAFRQGRIAADAEQPE